MQFDSDGTLRAKEVWVLRRKKLDEPMPAGGEMDQTGDPFLAYASFESACEAAAIFTIHDDECTPVRLVTEDTQ